MADLQIHAPLAIAAGAVFIPVCTTCVGLRVYARRLHGVSLGGDDWTIIAATVRLQKVERPKARHTDLAQVFVIGMGITLITGEYLLGTGKAAHLTPSQRLRSSSWDIRHPAQVQQRENQMLILYGCLLQQASAFLADNKGCLAD